MRTAVRMMVVVAAVVAMPAMAAAEEIASSIGTSWDCKGQTEERPYICDVGQPQPLSMTSFVQILQDDAAIRATVARIGMPDAVELQRVLVNDPWLNYEVRTYYRDYDRMYVFARAFVLGNPQVSLLRHEGPIPPHWLASHAPIDVDAAARRAEHAAARAEAVAERAERLADRAESIADAMAADFPRRLQKN
ncbi:MAG: hypothetical protein P8R42_26515 [Candidatus Binatia bacterium]|nr:hypothetical protein [Candidatus Binatia bacterium]